MNEEEVQQPQQQQPQQEPQVHIVPNNITQFPPRQRQVAQWMLWTAVALGVAALLALLFSMDTSDDRDGDSRGRGKTRKKSWDAWMDELMNDDDDDGEGYSAPRRMPREPRQERTQHDNSNYPPMPIIINTPGQAPTVFGGHSQSGNGGN